MKVIPFKSRSLARRLTGLATLAALSLMSSCVITTNSVHDVTGNFVSEATLGQVEPGASTEYVRSLLGDPTSQTTIDASTELWRWTHSESHSSNSTVLLLLSNRSESDVERTAFVEFVDGKVSKTWRD